MKISAKEINKLVLDYQNEQSESKRDTLWQKIYESQKGMIDSFLTIKASYMGQREDLEQELLAATVECINKYKPNMNANFNTYLYFYLKKGRKTWGHNSKLIRVQQYAKDAFKEGPNIVSLDAQLRSDSSLTLKDIIPVDFNMDEIDDILDLKTKLARLTEDDINIIVKRIEGYNFNDISETVPMSSKQLKERWNYLVNLLKTE